jgi:hypothetical protein
MVQRRRLTGSELDKVVLSTPTVAALGKSITTWSVAIAPNPSFRAYTQGERPSLVVHVNDPGGDPVPNGLAPVVFVPSKILIMPA